MEDDLSRRLLQLEGGINFRDMGGYPTADGRQVKWGKLYRSGSMARLTPADAAQLVDLGIRCVVDFRSRREQKRDPNLWCAEAGVTYWSRDHQEVFGQLHTIAFNCTAGKDRTGGAAALVLSVLGVPREIIVADFTLTEKAVNLRTAFGARPQDANSPYAGLPEAVMDALAGARPAYISAFLDSIAERCGSAEGYLAEIGVPADAAQAVRAQLLE